MNIPIVFEDDWIICLDKPAGLLVIPTPKNESRTLTSILNYHAAEQNRSYRFHPCHRLDREVSGLIIYAKGKSIQQKVMSLFESRSVAKKYIAFVRGKISPKSGDIRYAVDNKEAHTHYRVLEEREKFSVLEVSPATGRKNQIRIHFSRIGHPLIGETRFAFRKDAPVKAKRVCLHAQSLSFMHPFTGKLISLKSALSADLIKILDTER